MPEDDRGSLTGLGLPELTILEAFFAEGALSTKPRIKTWNLIAAVGGHLGLGPRYVWNILRDLGNPMVICPVLLDLVGVDLDRGPRSIEDDLSEGRLAPVGEAAVRAAMRGHAAVPLGLIMGDFYKGGQRPPFAPGALLDAIAQVRHHRRTSAREIREIVGQPSFPTGCEVRGPIESLMNGRRVTIVLAPSIEEFCWRGRTAVRLSKFPPDIVPEAVARTLHRRCATSDLPPLSWVHDVVLAGEAGRTYAVLVLKEGVDSGAAVRALREMGPSDPRTGPEGGDLGVVRVQVHLGRSIRSLLGSWLAMHTDEQVEVGVAELQTLLSSG